MPSAQGDTVSVDFDTGVITDETTGKTFQAKPFSAVHRKIIADGSLVKSLTKKEVFAGSSPLC